NCVGNLTKLTLLVSQLLFGLLQIVDVGGYSVPPDDLACLVMQRLATKKKPTIHSIMAAKTRLIITGFTRGQQRPPCIHGPRQVFRMKRSLPSPSARLFRGQTRIVLPTFVRKLVGSVGQIAVGLRGDRVDNLAKPCLRQPRLCQGFLQVLSCSALPGPLGDVFFFRFGSAHRFLQGSLRFLLLSPSSLLAASQLFGQYFRAASRAFE